MDDAKLRDILRTTKTIAVVGLSPKEDRPSHEVARFLQNAGYRIFPVNPTADGEILGEKVYPSLQAIPQQVDMVDVFRRADDTPPVAEAAVTIGAKTLWLQLGIMSEESRHIAERAGINYVEDRCAKIEVQRLGRN